MSIATRIEAIEEHIENAYVGLENLGEDLTNVDKNINNIKSSLDNIYSRLPKVSGTGSVISLTPTLKGKMTLEYKGQTSQDGTPTPSSPIDIQTATRLQNVNVCGKNLFDKNNIKKINAYFDSEGGSITSSDYNKVFYIPCNSNTTYTITQGISTLSNHVLQIATTTETPNINVIVSNYINYTSLTPQTYTTNATAKYLVFRIRSGDDVSSFWNGVQIEVGSTASTYEPYKGNTYEVNLGNIELNKIGNYQDSIKKSTGKNLFDKDNMNTLNAYINGSGIIKTDVNASVLYIPCKPNTSYAIQKPLQTTTSSNRFKVGCCSSIPTTETQLSKYNNLPNGTTNTTMIFETDSTANYLVFNFAGGNQSEYQNVINSIQIEENSQATDYEPYGKVWYIHKETRKLELAIADMNNSENSPGWRNQTQLYNDVYDGNIYGSLSNYTSFYTNIASQNQKISVNFTNVDSPLLYLSRSYFGNDYTQTYWKINYSDLIFTLVYGIKTPETIEITNQELINQLESIKSQEGTTNILITSENLPAILNASALKGDVE